MKSCKQWESFTRDYEHIQIPTLIPGEVKEKIPRRWGLSSIRAAQMRNRLSIIEKNSKKREPFIWDITCWPAQRQGAALCEPNFSCIWSCDSRNIPNKMYQIYKGICYYFSSELKKKITGRWFIWLLNFQEELGHLEKCTILCNHPMALDWCLQIEPKIEIMKAFVEWLFAPTLTKNGHWCCYNLPVPMLIDGYEVIIAKSLPLIL